MSTQSNLPIPLGGVLLAESPISFNMDKTAIRLLVRNTGDRPIQIGSHFHFFEANPALEFDRHIAYGKRLNITATTAIRFEPGDEIEVTLIPFGGKHNIYGFNNLVDGWAGDSVIDLDRSHKTQAVAHAVARGYRHRSQSNPKCAVSVKA